MKRAAVAVLALALVAGCGHGAAALPDWLQLKPGTQAHLGYADEQDPEHAMLFATAADALAGTSGGRPSAEGALVTIDAVDPRVTNGRRAVQVHGPNGVSGWVFDAELWPVPPPGTGFEIVARNDAMLYQEADDDDGVPFGGPAHVAFRSFRANPGNPEYAVDVTDGTLATRTGYVLANELAFPATHAFRLVAP